MINGNANRNMPFTKIKWMISIQIFFAIVVDLSWNFFDCTVNVSMDDVVAAALNS